MKKSMKIILIAAACAVLVAGVVSAGYFGYVATHMINAPDLASDEVRYIAHRGLSSEFYENTEAAFRAAAQSDFFFGIETDIYRTADGKYVCAHDNAAFEDASLEISSLTLDECLSLPLAYSEDYGMSGNDERLCTFETYLSVCRDGGKTAVIEFKPDFSEQTIREILAIAANYLDKDKIIVISFSSSNIENLASIDDGTAYMYLGTSRASAEFFARRNCPVGINADKATRMFVRRMHALGVTVNVWNVVDKAQAEELVGFGVDFVTTDFDFSKM